MRVRDIGRAGLVGTRGRAGEWVAKKVARRTALDRETVAAAIGLYLFYSRTRRMFQMAARLRGRRA